MSARQPVVGILCDRRMVEAHPSHLAGEKYIAAVYGGAEAIPLLIPVLSDPIPPSELLESIDGFLFTGSPSNVSPRWYAGDPPRNGVLLDEHRDMTTLPLLKAAVERGFPVLCVCRGFQELNVAFGGSLHQHVHEIAGRRDHRENTAAELDVQYAPAHEVHVAGGGLLARLVSERTILVNSLHSQGIDRLSPLLHADATASDGTIEAVSMPGANGFLLGVQWHPEWRWRESDVSRAILLAFGSALRSHCRRGGSLQRNR
jgi:putative glutamine amidotransferase